MSQWWFGESLGPNGSLTWAADPMTIGLAVLLALVSLVLVYRRPGTKKGFELVCWWLALFMLVWGISDPYWNEDAGRAEPGRSVVLIDASRSMSVTENGIERAEQVPKILENLGPDIDVYSFSDELRSGVPEDWSGKSTDLGRALRTVSDRYLGQSLRSVSVITDGIDRGGLREGLMASASANVPVLPGPLTVYQVGRDIG